MLVALLAEIVYHGKQSGMVKKPRLQLIHEAIERLTRLCDLFQQRREQLAASAGLTVGQWSVLEEISTEHFMPSMFARHEETSRAAVSKVIRQLLDRGLIQVAISQLDGRQRDYALTSEGKHMLGKLRSEREKAIEAIWLPLDSEALLLFSDFTGDLTERIQRYASQG
jgi:DNA-binding MarR family transcriptional regulator